MREAVCPLCSVAALNVIQGFRRYQHGGINSSESTQTKRAFNASFNVCWKSLLCLRVNFKLICSFVRSRSSSNQYLCNVTAYQNISLSHISDVKSLSVRLYLFKIPEYLAVAEQNISLRRWLRAKPGRKEYPYYFVWFSLSFFLTFPVLLYN